MAIRPPLIHQNATLSSARARPAPAGARRRGLRRPTATLLTGRGQINLSTTLGPIDPLCELGEGEGYEELLPHSVLMTERDLSLRVLDLPTLIAVKAKTGRAKDRAVLPVLIATLEESSKKQP